MGLWYMWSPATKCFQTSPHKIGGAWIEPIFGFHCLVCTLGGWINVVWFLVSFSQGFKYVCITLDIFRPRLTILGQPDQAIFGSRPPFSGILRKGSIRRLTVNCTKWSGAHFHRSLFELETRLFCPKSQILHSSPLTTPSLAQTTQGPFIRIYGDKFTTFVRFFQTEFRNVCQNKASRGSCSRHLLLHNRPPREFYMVWAKYLAVSQCLQTVGSQNYWFELTTICSKQFSIT